MLPTGTHVCTFYLLLLLEILILEVPDDDDQLHLVGYLYGILLPRPSPFFHEMASQLGGNELQEIAGIFCNSVGALDRVPVAGLEGTKDLYQGGFFHIGAIEVGKGHFGRCDLGLRLVHETLLFLQDDWTMAVMVPLLLDVRIQKWPHEHNRLQLDPLGGNHTKEQQEGLDLANQKLRHHFARMGFQQAGRNSDHHLVWYLTRKAYYFQDEDSGAANAPSNNTDNSTSRRIMERWLSRDEGRNLDVFVAPEKHVPTGVDARLQEVIFNDGTLEDVQEIIVNQGACIHNSRALFLAAAGVSTCPGLLDRLLKLGGDLSTRDENGNSPLHVAATMIQPKSIEYLLNAGCSRETKNDKEHTPFETLLDAMERMNDLTDTWTQNIPRPKETNDLVECLHLLMPNKLKEIFVDGWLSPRMIELLRQSTLSILADAKQKLEGDADPPLEEFISRIPKHEFIPPTELQHCFRDGMLLPLLHRWIFLLESVADVLASHQIPNVAALNSKMRASLEQVALNHKQPDLSKTAKPEYVLDAIITTARNTHLEQWFVNDSTATTSNDPAMMGGSLEEHPATPLDDAFDIARLKLLQLDPNVDPPPQLGPFDHDEIFDEVLDDEDEDE